MTLDRQQLDRAVDESAVPLTQLAQRIHEHPELRYEERQASSWIGSALEQWTGVSVESGFAGLETAFRARTGASQSPRIAILAEYDALPEIGHACGHNLIATGAVGAFVALASFADKLGGTVEIIGTPAEEGGGGKIRMLSAGAFQGVDAALMFHPADRDLLDHPFLAGAWLSLDYRGKPAHAAAAPWEGQSALTACLNTFQLVDSQRIHFRDGVRVHGIVCEGGDAVNVIAEHASSEFSVRARDLAELKRVQAIVERCARGAAMACGVELEVKVRQGYRELRTNQTIVRRFAAAMEALGRAPRVDDLDMGTGSTDMGDVSQHLPAIHPLVAICDEGESFWHTRSFAECSNSERGFQGMLVAAKAMARTCMDLLEDPQLLDQAKREFEDSNVPGRL